MMCFFRRPSRPPLSAAGAASSGVFCGLPSGPRRTWKCSCFFCSPFRLMVSCSTQVYCARACLFFAAASLLIPDPSRAHEEASAVHLSLRLLNFSEPIDGLRTVTLDSFGKLFRVLLWRLPPGPLHVCLRRHGYMNPTNS